MEQMEFWAAAKKGCQGFVRMNVSQLQPNHQYENSTLKLSMNRKQRLHFRMSSSSAREEQSITDSSIFYSSSSLITLVSWHEVIANLAMSYQTLCCIMIWSHYSTSFWVFLSLTATLAKLLSDCWPLWVNLSANSCLFTSSRYGVILELI